MGDGLGTKLRSGSPHRRAVARRPRVVRPRVVGGLRRRAGPLGGRAAWGGLLFALGLSLLVRWPLLGLPLISDEGGYAYVAQRWLDGSGRLYHDLWVSRPQGIFVVYGAIFATLGDDVVALRVGAWLATAATLALVWRFAGVWAGPRVAAVAAVVFALLAGSPSIEGFTANAEVFLALPAAAAMLALLRASRRGWGAAPLLVAGVGAGLATLLKPSGLVLVGVGVAFVWLLEPETRLALRRGGWIVAGFGLALAPALVHGWWVGWDEFVYAAITYRLTSQSGATSDLGHQSASIGTLVVRCSPTLVLLAFALVAHGRWPRPATVRGALDREFARSGRLGVVARAVRPVWRGEAGTLLLGLWLVGSVAGAAIGGDWWAHYLIQPAAPFAIWLAVLLVGAWRRLDGAKRPVLAAVAIVGLVGPYGVAATGDADRISRAIFDQRVYPSQDEVAAYLRQHTPPDASIFVAFDHPAIYHLAGRRAAYRHLYDAELKAVPGSYGALLDLIEGPNRPRYVVGTEPAPYPDRGKAFWDAVLRHYHIVDIIHGVPILRADDGLGRGR